MNTIRVLFTMLLVSLTTQWNFSQEEGEDSDRLLATVNGVEIHESDVIGSLVGSAGIQQEQRAKYIEHALKQAIDNELLYQAGIKEGLDKDPTYLKQLEMQKRMAVHREVESLATFYEQNVEGLRAARDRDAITDEECEDYYAQNQTRYKGRSKDRALRIIRSQLANKRYRSFYAEFFIELVKETTCSVAGQSIDSDVLLESADRSLNMSETRPSDADPFWVAVLDAAGVDMPEPTTGPPGEIDEELKGTIGKITVKIGNDEVTLGDSHQIDSLVSSVQNGRLGSELFYLFKPYIVVQKAVKEGVDKDPAFLKEKEQMSAITGAGMGGGMGGNLRGGMGGGNMEAATWVAPPPPPIPDDVGAYTRGRGRPLGPRHRWGPRVCCHWERTGRCDPHPRRCVRRPVRCGPGPRSERCARLGCRTPRLGGRAELPAGCGLAGWCWPSLGQNRRRGSCGPRQRTGRRWSSGGGCQRTQRAPQSRRRAWRCLGCGVGRRRRGCRRPSSGRAVRG